MTAATAGAPARRRQPPLVALTRYAVRISVPGRRWLGILLPSVAAVLFGLLSRATDLDEPFAEIAGEALFALVLPVTCLVIGDAVLGAEIRAGTFSFTWLTPTPPWHIVLSRWVGGSAVAGAATAVAFTASAIVAGEPGDIVDVVIAGVAAAACYVALFLMIGCVFHRAAAWSLAFVFIGERLLGFALPGIAQISPYWEGRAAFIGLRGGPEDLVREGIPSGTAALVRLALITIVCLVVASWRLRHLRLTGASD